MTPPAPKGVDPAAANAVLVSRAAPPPSRRSISVDDVLKTLALPFWGLMAWCTPERSWDAVCTIMARIRTRAGGGRSSLGKAIAAITPDGVGAASPATIAARLEAGRYEHYFQILRDYRPGGWRPPVEVVGREHIERARANGVGAVLWVGHFVFNGLAPKLALHQAGLKVAHLSRPEHGFSKTAYGVHVLNPIRARIEDRYLDGRILIKRGSETVAARQLKERVARGGIVSITAGAWEGRRIALAPIFGRQLPLATGAISLAISTGAPLLPLIVVRDEPSGIIRVVIEPPIDLPSKLEKDVAIAHAASEYARRLETWIRRYPGQWRGWRYVTSQGDAGKPS
jgi:lauroyl/myristoyl acyltransferase